MAFVPIRIRPVDCLTANADYGTIKSTIDHHVPFMIRGFGSLELGGCLEKWTPTTLRRILCDCRVSVHVAQVPNLSFLDKNFNYEYMTIGELFERIEAAQTTLSRSAENAEYLYYRSLGARPRKDPATLSAVHPYLRETFALPSIFDEFLDGKESQYNVHSTVFRISQSGVELWAHYDALDNLLINVYGRKRVLLFPPSELHRLAITDTSSPYQNVSEVHLNTENCDLMAAYENAKLATMEPGDLLFIPAGWSHSVKSECHENRYPDVCISVNTFLESKIYNHGVKNVYGNEDPLLMKKACDMMKGDFVKWSKELPSNFQAAFWSKLGIHRLPLVYVFLNEDDEFKHYYDINEYYDSETAPMGSIKCCLFPNNITKKS